MNTPLLPLQVVLREPAVNSAKDRQTIERLEQQGWLVLRYWEHEGSTRSRHASVKRWTAGEAHC